MGGTTVEHQVARSADASRRNDYANCLYACRFCNRSRSAKPLRRNGARLLDPARDAWGDHFTADGDRLRPATGDADAEYTHGAYELDDPRKRARRDSRQRMVSDRLQLLELLEREIAELLRIAGAVRRRDPRALGEILAEIREVKNDARRALEDLRRYAAVPSDAPVACHCDAPRALSLPEELERQTIQVPDKDLEAEPQDRLDLHGQTGEEAVRSLRRFILTSAGAGLRTVLVVTGKGIHSDRPRGALRDAVESWLAREGGRWVRAFSVAPRALGGGGAYLVHLR